MKREFDFLTFYNTFYLTSDGGTEIKQGWFDDIRSYEANRLFQLKNILAVKTGSYGHIKGEIYILNQPADSYDFENYDHVVEGYLEVQSGSLQFLECPGSQLEYKIDITPGNYSVRVYSSNLSTTDIDEMEGNDFYKIEMWINAEKELKVLKQFTESYKAL